ncbi:hypothetical protein Cme02nite_55440 [Catellatospora methionotrophica]|uniref:WXG100 family type VII secretion target n=1 Tax=Catellatospora methionotrophica TaxID=121620 RepID=A0A8J3LDH1_9ACTN|nr:hypothetical protein [Catellatospora methionotrophica]GIG17212.1 hypothetical protein Cme02nite_55440 [Catellatospora methionotrophica]
MPEAKNPLVAPRVDTTAWYSGVGIVETVDMLVDGVKSGSWVDSTLGGFGTAAEGAVWLLDPVGALVTAGFGWVVEHVQPLSDALDWLVGDPDHVAANAQTWRNVAEEQDSIADHYLRGVRYEIPDWRGAAAAAYRAQAADTFELTAGLAKASEAMGVIVEMTGSLVTLVRTLVRDLIGELVSILVARIPLWTAETLGTFGLATPYVEAQVAALVAKWGARIMRLIKALTSSLRNLSPALRKLDEIVETLARLMARRFGAPSAHLDGDAGFDILQSGGIVRRPRDAGDWDARWASEMYDEIRSADDVADVAATAAEHGFTPDDVIQIKNHLFHEEHLLDYFPPGEMARFDPNPRIAEAWQRLANGTPHPADLNLLRHELYESQHMARTGDPSYMKAHNATIEAGHPWNEGAAAADGLGFQG